VTWADAAKFAFQMSLAVLVFGSGLGARFADVTSLLRQPGLLVRSLLAIFVLAPLLAVLLVRVLDLGAEVSIALVALAISPLPPLLPKRGGKAGGDTEYGLGLVIVLAVLAVPVIVAAVAVLEIVFGRQYAAEPWAITRLVALSIVVPLAAGMTIAKVKPALAQRLSGPIERAQRWLLPIAMVVLVISAVPQIRPLIGTQTLLAFGVFVLGGFAIGQLLGGRDPHRAVVLAFATSCRHPATALVLASANFPGAQERGAVALYGLMTAAAGTAYTVWSRRHSTV
jgi:BASS family bile acid:Na+ symporter